MERIEGQVILSGIMIMAVGFTEFLLQLQGHEKAEVFY